eukprot:Pgem_evm1s19794
MSFSLKSVIAVTAMSATGSMALSSTSSKVECVDVYSQMFTNNLYHKPGAKTHSPPYSDLWVKGYSQYKLCTNGTMMGSADIVGYNQWESSTNPSEIIAITINEASNMNGTNGYGKALINFCGDMNQVKNGAGFKEKCMMFANSKSVNQKMMGTFNTNNANYNETMLINMIKTYPERFYVNVITTNSQSAFNTNTNMGSNGLIRGVVKASFTTNYTNHHTNKKCYKFTSDMMNNLKPMHPNSPDAMAMGKAQMTLCTDGYMYADTEAKNGKTELIAMHIHLASNGNGKTGSGEPVINFCGTNEDGLIMDGTDYLDLCMPWDKNQQSNTMHAQGKAVHKVIMKMGMTTEELVNDIYNNTGKYYLNMHSIGSWMEWNKQPKGVARGVVMKANGNQPHTNGANTFSNAIVTLSMI